MTTEGIAEGSAAEITVTFEAFYTQAWDDVYRAAAVAIGDHDLAAEVADEAMTPRLREMAVGVGNAQPYGLGV